MTAKPKKTPIAVDKLTETQAKREHNLLEAELKKHAENYYQNDAPTISDAEYDSLRQRYDEIEVRFPDLRTFESLQVGASPARGFAKVSHAVPMLSLGNAFKEPIVRDFAARIRRFLNLGESENVFFSAEPKIDGLSMSLRYERGKLVTAATRGDGAIGEDVTANIMTLKDVPRELKGRHVPLICEVRGEVYMTKSDFIKLNEQQKKIEGKIFANPRNSSAGSVRQKDPAVTASRSLGFFAYAWGQMSEMPKSTQSEMIKWFESCGFQTNPLTRLCHSVDELIAFYREIEEQRSHLDYDIDGVVYKVDRIDWQERLGFVEGQREPRWALAHKFPAERAITVLKDIEIQVGRTGSLTPVGKLEPIGVGGVIVQNVTLHNEDYIKGIGGNGEQLRGGNDIRIGDTVIIQRAGDVIPQVVDIVLDKRPDNARRYHFPKECPCPLHTEVVREETAAGEEGSRTRCTGEFACPYQRIERLKLFVSRRAFDIEGFGETYIQIFFEDGLINEPADIFKLHDRLPQIKTSLLKRREALRGPLKTKRPKSGSEEEDKLIKNLFRAIDARREIAFDRFIFSLGIRDIGEMTAKALAKHFRNVKAWMDGVQAAAMRRPGPDWLNLARTPSIGPITLDRLLSSKDQVGFDLSGDQSLRLLNKKQVSELRKKYGDQESIRQAIALARQQQPGDSFKELANDGDIGAVATGYLIEFFSERHNRDAILALTDQVRITKVELGSASGLLAGKIVVFTGSLAKVTRDEAKATAERLGAKVSGSVSSRTNIVVAGPGAGSKLSDAKKHGVKVISEEEWLQLIKAK